MSLYRFIILLTLIWMQTVALADGKSFTTRAIWVSPPAFASAQATDEMVARCQKAGLNLLLPNVMCYQSVAFKSPHFQGRVKASAEFDPLACLLQKAHAAGLRVEPWCCVYYEGVRGGSRSSSHPSWLNLSLTGRPFEQNFFSPSNPEVNPYLLSVIKDLLAYDIEGIHLDYIRYPGTAFDYSAPGRAAFKASAGFDAQDFLDHPERIEPPEQEGFCVRVLQPNLHAEQVWETTATERTLDQAGVGFAFVSESPERIDSLRVPGLLIISSYYDVPAEMVSALERYVNRGGHILWTDVPAKTLERSPVLQKLTGVASARWLGQRRIALRPVAEHSLAHALATQPFRTDIVSVPKPQGAKIIAELGTGEPAVLLNRSGKGSVMVLGFHLMKSSSPVVATLAKELVQWFRTDSGAGTNDVLAAKRAEWVAWRGDRVTQLVRDLSAAAKQKNPKLVISSSGGPLPFEFYGCYRDARRWLAEGLNEEVFPMNYTPDPAVLAEMLELQTASAPAGTLARIFPGLQMYAGRTVNGQRETGPQDAATVEKELREVQAHGYRGFCLFSYDYLTDDLIQVVRQFSGEADNHL